LGDIKIPNPEPFDGSRPSKLKTFLTQCQLVFAFGTTNFATETKKTFYAATLLRETAFAWIQPHLSDAIDNCDLPDNVTDDAEDITMEIFNSWDGFVHNITIVFGDLDAEFTSVTKLRKLRQTTTVPKYVAEFQSIQGNVDWDDTTLKDHFYMGLKDYVKDEIHRMENRPQDLNNMIAHAVKIDMRVQERQMEKRGHFGTGYNSYQSN
jgi:hypothetical protein